jgi:hypothetical protein
MKHPIITSLGLAVLASVSLVTPAFGALMCITKSGAFGQLDTATGVYTLIADDILSGDRARSLTSDGAGGFYMGVTNALDANSLYAVNTSGDVSMIGGAGQLVAMYGMDRSSDGTMYGYDYNEDDLGVVNTTTGTWSSIGSSGASSNSPVGGRLAFMNGILYGAMDFYDGEFGSFNLATGEFTEIATDAIYDSMVLASDGATLYGLNGNSLYTLSLDGSVQSELSITGVDAPTWTGASSLTAVPEVTSSFTMLGLIGSGLLLRRRTKTLR